ncbi:MAG TPA: nuclear transport factor 2 family protein [Blastocatellia bacterium]|jgi:ketosteroid isomerase-like protein|nr:nuclear transport factor 2 family protein [Blastocatellia bacterium]
MNRFLSPVIVALMLALNLQAQTAPDADELTRLLKEFLAGASRNDSATHDRFWAEDLIYTSSSGRRIGKADIMRDVRSAPAPKPGDPTTTYAAEDIRIQQYGDVAIVAFRLVGKTEKDGKSVVANYLNNGTFLKRNGKWQAVSWQATKMPRSGEDAKEIKKEIAAAQAAFHQAMLFADLKTLETLSDESFIWTHRDGEQMTQKQMLEQLRSGQLKYSKLETTNVTVYVYDDTAVVRGVSLRQRSSFPGSGGSGDASPFTAFYTLTFINKGGAWKAVAMHTSRP